MCCRQTDLLSLLICQEIHKHHVYLLYYVYNALLFYSVLYCGYDWDAFVGVVLKTLLKN